MRTKTSENYYINDDYTNGIKVQEDYIGFDTEEETQKAQKDKKLVFQINRHKMQTCINPYWTK